MLESQNPYASPETLSEAAKPKSVSPGVRWNASWDRLLLVLLFLICLVGGPLSLWDIETIVGSGIAITLGGVALLIRETYCRRRGRPPWNLSIVLGLAGPAFSVLVTAVIALRQWSPGDAEKNHVDWIVVAFASLFLLGVALAYSTLPTVSEMEERTY